MHTSHFYYIPFRFLWLVCMWPFHPLYMPFRQFTCTIFCNLHIHSRESLAHSSGILLRHTISSSKIIRRFKIPLTTKRTRSTINFEADAASEPPVDVSDTHLYRPLHYNEEDSPPFHLTYTTQEEDSLAIIIIIICQALLLFTYSCLAVSLPTPHTLSFHSYPIRRTKSTGRKVDCGTKWTNKSSSEALKSILGSGGRWQDCFLTSIGRFASRHTNHPTCRP